MKKGNDKKTDYRLMFMSGVIFMGAGVALSTTVGVPGYVMMTVGGVMMAVGARHRGEWKKD